MLSVIAIESLQGTYCTVSIKRCAVTWNFIEIAPDHVNRELYFEARMAKKLKTIFKHRQRQFEKNTDAVFAALEPATTGIIEYLNLKEEIQQGQLIWTNVVYQEKEELVTMIGLIQYPPGSQFQTADGEMISVNEDMVEYFSRILKFTLPYPLLDTGTTEEVVAFLQSLDKEEEAPVKKFEDAEFDFDDLTDEQKAAILVEYQDKAVH